MTQKVHEPLLTSLKQGIARDNVRACHSKRIHLGGSQRQLQEVANKIAACLPFDVKVTAQEVAA